MLKVAWNENYVVPLPEGHRFPMIKYDLIPEQLLYEGTIGASNIFSPEVAVNEDINRVHTVSYTDRLEDGTLDKSEVRRIGFPFSEALYKRERIIIQGTMSCAAYALQYGVAMNVAGGTHHAYEDRGEGFCILNDIAVAARWLLANAKATQILVVDLDVHQGNGTAAIFQSEPRVFTFSMHGAKNYPHRKEVSDLDVGLPDGIDDDAYLRLLDDHMGALLSKVKPDFIFFLSGVDVLATDKLGRLGLSNAGCRERDRMVLQSCHDHEIPVVASMGGGYSEKLADIVEAHANTFRVAQEVFF